MKQWFFTLKYGSKSTGSVLHISIPRARMSDKLCCIIQICTEFQIIILIRYRNKWFCVTQNLSLKTIFVIKEYRSIIYSMSEKWLQLPPPTFPYLCLRGREARKGNSYKKITDPETTSRRRTWGGYVPRLFWT